jgi:hypothetical protein
VMLRLALALCALVAGTPTPAYAHTLGPEFVSFFDRVTPSVPVTVQVAQTTGAPQLTVRVTGNDELTLIGEQQEPMARVGPRGAYANSRSPTWFLSKNPNKNPPETVDASMPPRWTRVTEEPELIYQESRAEWPHDSPPEDVRKIGDRTTIMDWRIPARYGGMPVEIQGHVDWIPRPLMLEIPILLMVAVGWLVVRFVAGRTPEVPAGARAMALGTGAGVIAEVFLLVIDLAGRPGDGVDRLAPLLITPGLALVAYMVKFVLRSDRFAILGSAAFGGYICLFAVARFLQGLANSTPVRLALVTEMALGLTLLVLGVWCLRHPDLLRPPARV